MLSTFLKTLIIGSSLVVYAVAAPFKVGVTAGPHEQIMQKIKEKADKEGMNIEIKTFNDFILPNQALDDGELNANSYQHQPFLDDQIKMKGYQLTPVAKTILMPMGLYSSSLKSLAELKDEAQIAIPNDATNGGRALLLLQAQGLLKLKEGVALPSLLDIVENPKKLKIIELEAPQLPRSLADVTAAVVNMDWILVAGIDPKTALVLEEKDSPYANVLVVKTSEKDSDDVKKLVKLYQSTDVKDYIMQEFKGHVIPAW